MELTEKFKHLEDNISILREIKNSVSADELNLNKRYEWEVRYGLLESIQVIIDISCKISSHYNLGNPNNYRECVELLYKNKFIKEDTAKKTIAMIGLRNLLVHEYVSIDNNKLHQFLNSLDDFLIFINEIRSEL